MPTPTGGKRVGYIRVSTLDQNVNRQLEGVELDKVFTEYASGKDTNRPQLRLMLDYLRDGDQLIVHSLDRLARNLLDLKQLVDGLAGRGVVVESLKENMTFTSKGNPMNTLLLAIMGGFAEFEREIIRERQREGIALARKAGKYTGRKPCLTLEQVMKMREQVAAGFPKSKLARQLGVSRESLYAYLRGGHPTSDGKITPPGPHAVRPSRPPETFFTEV